MPRNNLRQNKEAKDKRKTKRKSRKEKRSARKKKQHAREIGETSGVAPSPIVGETSGVALRPIVGETSGIAPRPIVGETSGVALRPIVGETSGVAPRPIVGETSGVAPRPIVGETSGVAPHPIVCETSGVAPRPKVGESSRVAARPNVPLVLSALSLEAGKTLDEEYVNLRAWPPELIEINSKPGRPQPMRFLLKGPPDTPYEGGVYQCSLKLCKDVLAAPPKVVCITPNGLLKVDSPYVLNTQEPWKEHHRMGLILEQLGDFLKVEPGKMPGKLVTGEFLESSDEAKKEFARASINHCLKDPLFEDLFPITHAELMAKQGTEEPQ